MGRAGTLAAVAFSAHNPEVAGSNPAPATNVVAGKGPFPIGRGPLACVARDQIRDQITDQRPTSDVSVVPLRLRRNAEMRFVGHSATGRDTWDAVAGSKPSGRSWDLTVRSMKCHLPGVGKHGSAGAVPLGSFLDGPHGLQGSWSRSLIRVWISTPVTGPITRAAIR